MSFYFCCRRALSRTILVLSMLARIVNGLDLPVATLGTEQWAGVVAQALMRGNETPEKLMKAVPNFRSMTMAKFQDHVSAHHELFEGPDI